MNLCSIYHHEIPEFLLEFANVPEMLRLQHVGMHCGCEYTQYPIFQHLDRYSRYEHSLGVALIIWHFTEDKKQTISGLFHDISTPAFSHVIDFLNNDHVNQESTEDGTREMIVQSQAIQELLHKYHLTTDDVCDYHLYPIADNDTPKVSSDRLEYTLNNLLNFNFTDITTVKEIYQDLVVSNNENGEIELVFQHQEIAIQFAKYTLACSKIYVCHEDRYSMQMLAELLKRAISDHVIILHDLYRTEEDVIHKLQKDNIYNSLWKQFCNYHEIMIADHALDTTYRQIPAKKRYMNPFIMNKGRVAEIDPDFSTSLQQFLQISFSDWISGR